MQCKAKCKVIVDCRLLKPGGVWSSWLWPRLERLCCAGGFTHADQGVWRRFFHGSAGCFKYSHTVHRRRNTDWLPGVPVQAMQVFSIIWLSQCVFFQHVLQPSVVLEWCRRRRGRSCFPWSLKVVRAQQRGPLGLWEVLWWPFYLVTDVHSEGFWVNVRNYCLSASILPFSITADPALSVTGVWSQGEEHGTTWISHQFITQLADSIHSDRDTYSHVRICCLDCREKKESLQRTTQEQREPSPHRASSLVGIKPPAFPPFSW